MITVLRDKTLARVHGDVSSFASRYVRDWERWLLAPSGTKAHVFAKTLGKWQATRPVKLRRCRIRATEHRPPYIEDLITAAAPHLRALARFRVGRSSALTSRERRALENLWNIFSSLQQTGTASCVGITKAVLLLSDGRIGPAFDSQVRKKVRVRQLKNASEWIAALVDVSDDILAFEAKHGMSLSSAVPIGVSMLQYGRLYDMALGPR